MKFFFSTVGKTEEERHEAEGKSRVNGGTVRRSVTAPTTAHQKGKEERVLLQKQKQIQG